MFEIHYFMIHQFKCYYMLIYFIN